MTIGEGTSEIPEDGDREAGIDQLKDDPQALTYKPPDSSESKNSNCKTKKQSADG